MKQIDALNKKFAENKSELARLHGEINRCETAVKAASSSDDAIAVLRRKRSAEVATAFIYKREPVVKDIDAAIAAAEKASFQVKVDGEASKVGLEVIETRCIELREQQETIRTEAVQLLLEEATTRQHQAVQRYQGALEDLGEHVLAVSAASSLRLHLMKNHHSTDLGTTLYTDLQICEAIKIDGPNGRSIKPRWMHSFGGDAQQRKQDLHSELDKLGITQ